MNKKTIITILLVLVAMAGQAKVSIPESIADTYWRNEVTPLENKKEASAR